MPNNQFSFPALHISFLTPTVLEASLDVLKSRLEAKSNLTVLVEAAVLAADPRAQQPLIKPRQFIRRVKEVNISNIEEVGSVFQIAPNHNNIIFGFSTLGLLRISKNEKKVRRGMRRG